MTQKTEVSTFCRHKPVTAVYLRNGKCYAKIVHNQDCRHSHDLQFALDNIFVSLSLPMKKLSPKKPSVELGFVGLRLEDLLVILCQ